MSTAARTPETYQPAVAYLRRSTDRQEQSIGDQRKAIERHAQEYGFDLLDCYVDDAISGTSSEERKAFLRLIADAGAPDCSWRYVLVYDIKRFGRLDNDEAGHYRFQPRRHGIEVIYVSEGWRTACAPVHPEVLTEVLSYHAIEDAEVAAGGSTLVATDLVHAVDLGEYS